MFDFDSTTTPSSTIRSPSPVKRASVGRLHCIPSREDHDVFDGDFLSPPVALTHTILNHTTSAALPSESCSRPARSHQHSSSAVSFDGRDIPPLTTRFSNSLTARLSKSSLPLRSSKTGEASPSRSAHLSPSKEKEDWEFTPTLTGDRTGQISIEAKGGLIADWFKGSSDPVNLSVIPPPTRETPDPILSTDIAMGGSRETTSPSYTARPSSKLQKKTAPPPIKQPPASTSRFSFFGSKTQVEQSKPVSTEIADDEWINLDIDAALFPGGRAVPFSPVAFKNLEMNAERTLFRMQTAYKLQTLSLQEAKAEMRETTSEKSALQDELEESQTRNRHLKMQLDNMAEKALAQDQEMRAMAEELAFEKQKRQQEEEARKRSVMLVKGPHEKERTDSPQHAEGRYKKRPSGATLASDFDFESDDDIAASSIFSVRDGASSPATTFSSGTTSPEPGQPTKFSCTAQSPQSQTERPPAPPKRASTFQKVLHDLSATDNEGSVNTIEFVPVPCANCERLKGTEKWGLVEILSEENKGLKDRIGFLEGEVDHCLDIVHSFNI